MHFRLDSLISNSYIVCAAYKTKHVGVLECQIVIRLLVHFPRYACI